MSFLERRFLSYCLSEGILPRNSGISLELDKIIGPRRGGTESLKNRLHKLYKKDRGPDLE